ncbi:DUF4845 domain-containing protein [Zhongshania arctica]|uniref:DUF4845 domain-containing protein n=1 Tax=Zhongshania arctica TaxID=3238302 RepID=A0ABV3TY00_9GAMM
MKAKQAGIGMIPTVLILGTVIIFATVGVKLMPIYVDYWTLTRILEDVASEERDSDPTPAGVRRDISGRFLTNRVEAISLRDIKISNDKKGVVIDARYEKRTPLIFNIDAVVRFDDALYVVPRR